MPNYKRIMVNLPEDMVVCVKRIQKEYFIKHKIPVSRSMIMRMLILQGIHAWDKKGSYEDV